MEVSEAQMLADDVHKGLGAPLRLHREAALQKLDKRLQDGSAADQQAFLEAMCSRVLQLLPSEVWQHRLGGFDAAKALVPALPHSSAFLQSFLAACQDHLEDEEPRVRGAVADCVRELAQRQGSAVFDAMGQQVVGSIQAALARDPVMAANGGAGAELSSGGGGAAAQPDFLGQLLQTSYRQQRPGEGELRHDTEGWHSLESSFKALQALMEGCGAACRPHLTPELRQLVLNALLHQNRFVRERGYRVVQAMLGVCNEAELHSIAPEVAARLADGLNDSWSHVQYAASEATRAFLRAAAPFREEVLPALLPAMCFNRHATAEGLRAFSQQTWVEAMGDAGRSWVARCIGEVVAYYGKQTRSNSTDFRETGCACMAELARKIERAAIAPHVGGMLLTLLGCFHDSSWPVREAACDALGHFAVAYPAQTRGLLPQLLPLWLEHLGENVASVRETAAVALGNAVRAFGPEALATVLPQAWAMLRKVEEQPADTDNYVRTSYGVAAVRVNERRAADADAALFGGPSPDPVTYQKGIGKTARLFSTSALSREPANCCMDDGFQRERQPWEAADGAIYLVRELAGAAPDTMTSLMPLLAEAVRAEHYAHACHLQETAWRQLPLIGQALGKRGFKRYLEPFVEPLFRSVQSASHQGCQSAAIAAAAFLRDWLGPRIFAGRLTHEQQQLMVQFVPTVVRANKSCYVAEYDKTPLLGGKGATPALAH